MTEPSTPPAEHTRGALVRDVLVIVFAGAALGLGFNALQLSAEPARALPWLHHERKVVTLDELPTPAPSIAPPVSAAPGATPTSPAEPVELATKHGKLPARADTSGAKPAHVKPAAGSAPPKATAVATPGAPATAAATAPTSAAAPGLPAIPDSREPIEAKLDVAQKFYAAGAALFLDARSPEEYAEGHIAGALNVPFDEVFKNPALARAVDPKGRPIITYCGGGDCDLSRSLAFSLIDAGFRKVLVFTGGIPAWRDGGQPMHTGKQP